MNQILRELVPWCRFEQLPNPVMQAAFPQALVEVSLPKGLFGRMNPGTDMNPNDPFGCGDNRDTMNDLLTPSTRERLLFGGESGYEGDSIKRLVSCRVNDPVVGHHHARQVRAIMEDQLERETVRVVQDLPH